MAKDILEEIVAYKRQEVEQAKQLVPPTVLYRQVEPIAEKSTPSMASSLKASPTGIIAEFKRKSPSKGWINEAGQADVIPLGYQQQGATAVSILTDSRFFGGCDDYISTARQSGVTIPILYKNFVIDEYQLLQARLCGASAVLLIAACLQKAECRSLLHTAHEIGLEVLLEMHAEEELDYAELGPDMCGINNRHLGSFVTDVETSFRMAERLRDVCGYSTAASPAPSTVLVSESGISVPTIVCHLRAAGYRGFLIGENFMKTPDPAQALNHFIQQL